MQSFFQFASESMPALLRGMALSVEMWIVCISFGFVLGVILALLRVYGGTISYGFATAYIEAFRGTPMLVQIFFVYLGLPEINIVLRPFVAASVAIALNTAAYQAEYIRGSIQSVETGQMTASRSLGMSKLKAIFYIILPQALRRAIPQLSNEAILELKFTSLAFAIGVRELMGQAKIIGFTTFRYFEIFILAAILYLILTTVVASLLDKLTEVLKVPGFET